MSSKVKGLDQLLANLSGLGGNIKSTVRVGLDRGAKKIQKNAKLLCPVDTGQLRSSIKTKSEETQDGAKAEVYTNVEYAAYVEFGTGIRGASSNIDRPEGVSYNSQWKGQKAQPYMSPAYLHAKNSGEVEQEIIKKVEQEIRKMECGNND